MLDVLRGRTTTRDIFVVLSALALAFKLLFPPGFMPGTSLSQPLMLCGGQGTMPASAAPMVMPGMDHGGDHAPDKMPKGATDHACPFAGLSATPLTPDTDEPVLVAVIVPASAPTVCFATAAPGRGMAAPPPPSHAPPALRA